MLKQFIYYEIRHLKEELIFQKEHLLIKQRIIFYMIQGITLSQKEINN